MSDLAEEEYQYLWGLVWTIQGILELQYNSLVFNIAVQDVPAAGESVPHIHIHILPRNDGDLDLNGKIYDRSEEWVPRAYHNPPLKKFDFTGNDVRRDLMVKETK